MTDRVTVEFTVEPFVEGNPGPHVRAAIAAVELSGITPEVGPFGTTFTGPTDAALGALGTLLRVALAEGATRVSVQVTAEAAL